jgi:hypothetical protein
MSVRKGVFPRWDDEDEGEAAHKRGTRVQIPGTDQHLFHECAWNCPRSDVTVTTEEWVIDGVSRLLYFTKCAGCGTKEFGSSP